ncbi:hypothetical protein EGY05_12770 [Chryseobacterium arthrosphaerae]|uniref:GNAT family N-acetyltransferase n=1 Tax=Chryseobacterium arthrosphaerae TaxID=651561 RepID=UPI000F4FBEBE|nr:hypothetical protein [Chryseobacterium arthrosphaerae]AYZ12739.1 hypothetical protein EGY05_12770 [Chryseobacterium arthrosphaerae]
MNYTANDNPVFFKKFLGQNIADKSLYQYTYLQNQLEEVLNGNQNIYSDSLVNVNENDPTKWILIINTDSFVSFYGSNWSTEQIKEVLQTFDFRTEDHSFICGTEKLILEVLLAARIKEYEIGKRRIFYKTSLIKKFNYSDYNIQRPDFNIVSELARMLQMYYHEEYQGKNDKTIEDMYMRINDLILSNEIFIIKDPSDQHIISFCSIKDSNPGILFTNQPYRNQGYGQILLSYCSNLLLVENEVIYLMTDADLPESNVLSQKIGFTPFYEYITIDTIPGQF